MDKTVVVRCRGLRDIAWKDLQDFQGSLKTLSNESYENLKALILKFGFSFPFQFWQRGEFEIMTIDGHQRLATLRRMEADGYSIPQFLPGTEIFAENEQEAKQKLLASTSQFGKMSGTGLAEFMLAANIKFDQVINFEFPEIDMGVFKANFVDPQGDGRPDGSANGETVHGKLNDKFIVPPFSILDSKQGYWQDRRRQWLSLGIQSEVGRKANLLGMSSTMLEPDEKKRNSMNVSDYEGGNAFQGFGTSIFDPVICELAYKWFCPKGGRVLDPFAGGSVRGIVASKCGLLYTGIELRQEQVAANVEQAAKICGDKLPIYICDDAANLEEHMPAGSKDLIFSCPPYADLEKYSDDPRDLSNMEYVEFLETYRDIIVKSVAALAQNRFCVWVVSDIRFKDQGGFYRGLVKDTIGFFEEAGAGFYNDMVLLNSIGTTALRAGRTFSATRKVGRIHQNVLVFCKGDIVSAVQELGEIEVSLPENLQPEG